MPAQGYEADVTMDNLYEATIRGFSDYQLDYIEVTFDVAATSALNAVRQAFDIASSFGLEDKTLLCLELVDEDV